MRLSNGARSVLFGLALAAAAEAARADFNGQPILGPLSLGGSSINTTLGKADDNDGFDSGTHIFNIWDGGDDVFALNWPGGNMTVTLINLAAGVDNDLFIYRPGSLNSSGDYSTLGGTFPDVVTILGASAGTYYINIDSTFFSEGSYQVSVAPAPGSASLLALVGLLHRRRRRTVR